MLYSYLKYTLDFGMKMPPRDGNLRGLLPVTELFCFLK